MSTDESEPSVKPPSGAIPEWGALSPLLKNLVISVLQREMARLDADAAKAAVETGVMQMMMQRVQGAVAESGKRGAPEMAAMSDGLTQGIAGSMEASRMYIRGGFLSALQELSK